MKLKRTKKLLSGITIISVLLLLGASLSFGEANPLENYDGSPDSRRLVLEALASGANPYTKGGAEGLPLHYRAVLADDGELIGALGGYKVNFNDKMISIDHKFHSPLSLYAARGGWREETFQALLRAGMNPLLETTGREALLHAASQNNLAALKGMLKAGVSVVPTLPIDSAIQRAARAGHFTAVDLLLDANADIFATDRQKASALELIRRQAPRSTDPAAGQVLEKAEKIAAGIKSKTAMTIQDAQRLLRYPESMIGQRLAISPDFRFRYGILDSGFKGLKEWLERHPEEKQKTHFAYNIEKDETDHGYWVYRVVRTIAPDAEIYIGRALYVPHLQWLGRNKVGYASMSVSNLNWVDPVLSGAPSSMVAFMNAVNQTGVYLFNSSGNQYRLTDTSQPLDTDGNGWLELFRLGKSAKQKELYPFKVRKDVRATINVGSNYWRVPHQLEAEMVAVESGRILPVPGLTAHRQDRGNLIFQWTPDHSGWLAIRARADGLSAEKRELLQVRIMHRGGTSGFQHNGEHSATFPSEVNSPYIISVGSVGRDPDTGKPFPSAFSSIGKNAVGLIPHVSGPGELIIDNRVINGTSFSTPLIGALASFRSDFSPRSMLAQVSTHEDWTPGVDESRKGAWGIPSFERMGDKSLPIFSSKAEVSKIGAEILKNGDFRVKFAFKKPYMQGMRLFFRMMIIDPATQKPLMRADGAGPLEIATEARELKDLFYRWIFLDIPMTQVPEAFRGRKVYARVFMSSGLWRDRWSELSELYKRLTLPE
jgi:hypothetical protein